MDLIIVVLAAAAWLFVALLTLALGLTAAAHLFAAILGLIAALFFMLYLAEYRRSYVMQVVIYATLGALLLLFAFYGFHLAAFGYVFTGGAARFWFSLNGVRHFAGNVFNGPILTAIVVALMLYVTVRRSRYFGNTAPLLMVLALVPLITTQTVTAPWLWTLPFLFTFVGGVFADAIETRHRRLFLVLTGTIVVTQALACFAVLPLIARFALY